jgi:hypothetical protein
LQSNYTDLWWSHVKMTRMFFVDYQTLNKFGQVQNFARTSIFQDNSVRMFARAARLATNLSKCRRSVEHS